MGNSSDSDCEVQMKKVSSTKSHKVAPEDSDFMLIFKPVNSKKFGLCYTLKKNQVLPYTPNLDGKGLFNIHCGLLAFIFC